MKSNEIVEYRFSPDFASRVLRQADATIARRREVRRTVAGAAAVSLVLAGFISWASLSGTQGGFGPPREPAYVELSQVPASSNDQTDALDFMFPDAAPVARFAAEYSDTVDDSGADSDMLAALDAGTP